MFGKKESAALQTSNESCCVGLFENVVMIYVNKISVKSLFDLLDKSPTN